MSTKKITLAFNQRLNETHAVASKLALEFFGEFVAFGTNPRVPRTKPIVCQQGYNKFICGCHAESKTTQKGFTLADCVVASISPIQPGSVSLAFRFFRTGEKQPFGEMQFTFGKDGPAGGASCSMPS
ncbi:MAG: hypothetical protein WC762_13710 [Methylobacter sp.]